ncbi:heme o synthase [Malassezia cuniculi]|uniref:Protoheme IX farnesyltransferase, mitochondrial n=1 Tax=Malassezia cuniculi TaxID=948313 RepID=A0AAF0F1W7_9BASI|nr:heme o synthase [Malassezia cuniculi]
MASAYAVRLASLAAARPRLGAPLMRPPAIACLRMLSTGRARISSDFFQQNVRSKYAPASNDPETVEILPTTLPPSTLVGKLPQGFVPLKKKSPAQLVRVYRQLAKSRLTFLVVLSGMMGYALCPASLCVATTVPPVLRLLALAAGITLCSTSANALNQIVEAPYDAQMARTRARPLPRRALSPTHAFTVATTSAVAGIGILAGALNPLTAALGAANIVLYSFIYTPMKRASIANTWVGAVVGGLPPLMGWASCTGTLTETTDAAAWVLAGILFAWQFPHFNALAHVMGNEYARGGYRMMAVTNPALNQRVALRYALVLLPLCSVALPLTGTVYPTAYAALSLVPNLAFVWYAARFWRFPSEKTARKCFWASLFYLPAVMVLAMACKSELWSSVYDSGKDTP